MKRTITGVLVLCTFILCGVYCDNDNPRENRTSYSSESITKEPDKNYDSLLSVIKPLQDSIYQNPSDISLFTPFFEKAFDSTSGSFYVLGKGFANKNHPRESWNAARKAAARYSGQRWALYLKAYQSQQPVSFGTSMQGQIVYSKVVHETLQNDTLYQLLQIPASSVVLK